nr:MAG: hypothetical protein [Chemarfal virus 74]
MHTKLLTPRGAVQFRHSIPSGHAFTNMFGTLANVFGSLYVFERLRQRGESDKGARQSAAESMKTGVPYCLALGDDTVHLAPRALTPAVIEELYKELG